ncbi:hypothetical protein J3Q64DRAFT_1730702 [Phycomyces blakesleeanus]|uniref:Uncharacterized protein n=1 Tax=Phycomyces blakesleeanus TaxID=4837 RepID=A0ABR3B5F3_PHYBL
MKKKQEIIIIFKLFNMGNFLGRTVIIAIIPQGKWYIRFLVAILVTNSFMFFFVCFIYMFIYLAVFPSR